MLGSSIREQYHISDDSMESLFLGTFSRMMKPITINTDKDKTAPRYLMLSPKGARIATTDPHNKGPKMAAAFPEKEYSPKNSANFSFGTKLTKSGRADVQVDPIKIPMRLPIIQNQIFCCTKVIAIRQITQPPMTNNRVCFGPILSVMMPKNVEPIAAAVVVIMKNGMMTSLENPITFTA